MKVNISFDPRDWNSQIARLSNPHILQTKEWGEIKRNYGWQPSSLTWSEDDGSVVAAGLVLQRAFTLKGLPVPLRVLYLPKGPLLLDWTNERIRQQVLIDLVGLAKKANAIFVKIDPDVRRGYGIPDQPSFQEDDTGQQVIAELKDLGWRFSQEQIQFKNTVMIDLSPSLDEILANMKQKTRYNIRLAQRREVTIRQGSPDDFKTLYRIYALTSTRDGFVIREEEYYQKVWMTFLHAGLAELLIAEIEDQIVAGLFLFVFARKAWYLYGMSSQAHREKMPNHLLQWEAILRAKEKGCLTYDLWGAPDKFEENDPLWGVFRFKDGFGGKVVCHIGAWDLPIRPMIYRLYTQFLPRLLEVMRRRGKARSRRIVNPG